MRPIRTLAAITLLPCLALTSACSSIDRASEIKQARLAIGSSSKSDVVHAIGLPKQTIRKDGKDVELWLYTGKPAATSLFIPMPVAVVPGGTYNTVYLADIGPKNVVDDEPVSLICVFDRTGRLIDVQRPN